ncbi:hypothetical protein BKA70DRAFT_1225777 [Coprinopsis sp. MPI-PUGE-AT-0042]|nr:hypothetical protein BKA70DRAFT_1225777 [Coprinopsis sp. MPI-PUGE-AT-0042]
MTIHTVPSGLSASRVRERLRVARLSIWSATSRSPSDRGTNRLGGAFEIRVRPLLGAFDLRSTSLSMKPQAMLKRSQLQRSMLLSLSMIQVIHLSSELSEYLRPTDRLRAKVDSNLTMAISLDDPSLKIVHEIRGGWFGLVLFMFGWVNGVSLCLQQAIALVVWLQAPLNKLKEVPQELSADGFQLRNGNPMIAWVRAYMTAALVLRPTAAHMELVGSSDLGSPSWSRQDSAFLRSYPWDDTVLLVGAARDLEKNFQAQEGDSAMVDPALCSDLPLHGHSHGASGAEAQSVQHFFQVPPYFPPRHE